LQRRPVDRTAVQLLHVEALLPGGAYKADWINPASGEVLSTETFTHQGGDRMFHTPQHAVDVALRGKRV